MEHTATSDEMVAMSIVDFVVPLKQVGIITRSVLEAIHNFYRPRRIIVVTKKSEADILTKLLPYWNVGRVECIDEETFFIRNFNLSFTDITAQYDPTRSGDQREPGWWIQQLIKIGAATQIPNISSAYVVWDGDLVPTRRWRLCSVDPVSLRLKYHIAILQGESRSEFNTTQYAKCMEALTGLSPIEPCEGGTFVAHHMVFQTKYVTEMLQLMAARTACSDPWPLMIMASSREYYRFSEYKTYATFMMKMHRDEFNYHELCIFGEGGLRFRNANKIIDDMVIKSKIEDGGLRYAEVSSYINEHWASLTTPGQQMPAYVQLDHVYGLSDFNLNVTSVPPSSADVTFLHSNSNSTSTSITTPNLSIATSIFLLRNTKQFCWMDDVSKIRRNERQRRIYSEDLKAMKNPRAVSVSSTISNIMLLNRA